MKRLRVMCSIVLTTCSIGLVVVAVLGSGNALDPAEVSGAAPDTCFDCKDMKCDYCPRPKACKALFGYCEETVRNMSQFCEPRIGGQWERCKYRVDDSGSCVIRFMNPCISEVPICWNPVDKCGPLGICIPEGICVP